MNRIAGVEDLRPGEMKEIIVQGHPVLLIRAAAGFFAVGSRCTHLGCKLSQGTLEEEILTCPCHYSRFDVRSGQVMAWIPKWPGLMGSAVKKLGLLKPLPVYPLEIRDQDIYLTDPLNGKEG
jgi:nitrite reductase/ring-hydroxylating ferredoxin subunit